MMPQKREGEVVNGFDLRGFGSILQTITLLRKCIHIISAQSILNHWNRFLKVLLYAIFFRDNLLKYHQEGDLPADRPYVFGYHPHGKAKKL
jgi:hypothetical protein